MVAPPPSSLLEAPSAGTPLAAEALIEEARRRQRRRRVRVGLVLGLALVLLGSLLVVTGRGRTHAGTGSVSGRSRPAGVFAHPTGVVLIFGNGLSLDLDHRRAARRPLYGQRAGDQPWDIVPSGNSLVVGWGQVWATPLAGGRPRSLGPVVFFVPAAERGAVWLIDYPGGRIGLGTPTIREVSVTGTLLRRAVGPPPSAGVPVVGVPGGIAFDTRHGLALWDASTRTFRRRLGHAAAFVGDAAGGRVAWCEGLCTSLHVTDVTGPDRVFASPQPRWVVEPESLRVSPDGRYVAVLTTRPGIESSGQLGTLDVVDVRTGHVDVVRRGLSAWSELAWADRGDELYFVADAARGMKLGEFGARTGRSALATVPIEHNAEQFVVLDRAEATTFLVRARGSARTCQAQPVGVGASTRACGFSF